MKELIFKCSKTVERKSGRKVKCNRFLAAIGSKITLVCAKCGTQYTLSQRKDGLWELAVSIKSILKVNFNKEPNHVKT